MKENQYFDKSSEEAKTARVELFEMLIKSITQNDKDDYIEELKDLEHEGKKIGAENVKSLFTQLGLYHEKCIKDKFANLDDFYYLVMEKKNYLTYFIRCASMNIFNDLKKDIPNLRNDPQGKHWIFLHDELNAKFLDIDHDFDSMETTIACIEELNKGSPLAKILKIH